MTIPIDLPDWLGALSGTAGQTPASGSYDIGALGVVNILPAVANRVYILYQLRLVVESGGAVRLQWEDTAGVPILQHSNTVTGPILQDLFGAKTAVGVGIQVRNLFNVAQASVTSYTLIYGFFVNGP